MRSVPGASCSRRWHPAPGVITSEDSWRTLRDAPTRPGQPCARPLTSSRRQVTRTPWQRRRRRGWPGWPCSTGTGRRLWPWCPAFPDTGSRLSLLIRCIALTMAGRTADARNLLDAARQGARPGHGEVLECLARGFAGAWSDDLDAAKRDLEAIVGRPDGFGGSLRSAAHWLLADVYYRLGAFDDAAVTAELARSLLQDTGRADSPEIAMAYAVAAYAAAARGDWADRARPTSPPPARGPGRPHPSSSAPPRRPRAGPWLSPSTIRSGCSRPRGPLTQPPTPLNCPCSRSGRCWPKPCGATGGWRRPPPSWPPTKLRPVSSAGTRHW